MNRDKSPGSDGFNPGFYQTYWSVVGPDITENCLRWLNTRHFPADLNQTNLVLIPKKNKPTTTKELRPISLCKVLYKILSKVIANRLKKVLPEVVSKSQSAFVEGSLITDNIVVVNEIVHYMNGLRTKGCGVTALKINIAKAYDRLE